MSAIEHREANPGYKELAELRHVHVKGWCIKNADGSLCEGPVVDALTGTKSVGFLPPEVPREQLSRWQQEEGSRPRQHWTLDMLETACFEFRAAGAWDDARIVFDRGWNGGSLELPRIQCEVLTQPIELPRALARPDHVTPTLPDTTRQAPPTAIERLNRTVRTLLPGLWFALVFVAGTLLVKALT